MICVCGVSLVTVPELRAHFVDHAACRDALAERGRVLRAADVSVDLPSVREVYDRHAAMIEEACEPELLDDALGAAESRYLELLAATPSVTWSFPAGHDPAARPDAGRDEYAELRKKLNG